MTPGHRADDPPQLRALQDRVGQLEGTVAALRRESADHERRAAALAANEAQWRQLVETMPQILWVTRPDGWHVHFNQQWTAFTGRTLEESLGQGWSSAFHPDDRTEAAERWEEATRTGEPYEVEYRLRRADGVYRWMLGRATPLRDETGRIVQWFGTCTDIEELKRAQARIDGQARLLDLAQDAIVVHDLDHRVMYWNAGAQRILGWTAAEAVGRHLTELMVPDIAQVQPAMATVLRTDEWAGELRYVDRTGAELIMEGRWTLLRRDDGTPRAVLAVNTDVTERKAIEAEFIGALEARATHDQLTGVPNRALLFDRLELLLNQRQGAGVAVAFIDLDGFKTTNDRLGHRVGDALLIHVARSLEGSMRQGDVVARIGGDEFVVVGEAEDPQAALALGERLAAAVSGTVEVGSAVVTVSASIGVAFASRDDDVDPDDLLSRADDAMYGVKRTRPGAAALEQHPAPTGD